MKPQIHIPTMAIAEPSKESNVTFSRKVKSLLGYGLQTWEQFMLGSLVFAGLAAVAVAFSTVVVVKLQRTENAEASAKLEEYKIEAGKKVAELNKQSDRLKADAEASRAEIAKANEGAAEANKVAAKATERANVAALELEKYRAPRVLTEEAIARIVPQIKAYAGTKFAVAIPGNDREIEQFALQIEASVLGAAWLSVDWKSNNAIAFTRPNKTIWGLASAMGIVLEIHEVNAAKLVPATKALAIALNNEGYSINISIAKESHPEMSEVVKIIVGNKQ